jgi:hypothetical protein
MPENNKWIWAAVIAVIVGFLIGLAVFSGSGYDKGYSAGKASVPIVKEANFDNCKEFSVPVDAQSCGALGLVYPTICENQTVELDKDYVGTATDDFMNAYQDNEDSYTCDGKEFDFDQISVYKVYKSYSVDYSKSDEYTVNFEVKLKYLDTDVDKKCYNTFNVSVFYEPTEDPQVNYTY